MNAFIALTPYHLLLTLLAKQRKESDLIILIDETGNLRSYANLGEILGLNFAYLPCWPASGIRKHLRRQLRFPSPFRQKLQAISLEAGPSGQGATYVFNDSPPPVQYLARLIGKDVVYIEDGAAPYNNHYIKTSMLKRMLYAIVYGSWYEPPNVLGTTSLVKRSVFTFPDRVRIENTRTPRTTYEIRQDYAHIVSRLTAAINGAFTDSAHRPKSAIMLLLPRNNLQPREDEYSKYLQFAHAAAKAARVYVKPHPLDGNTVAGIFGDREIFVAPADIASEAFLFQHADITSVYGPPNTSMISTRFFFPHIQATCLTENGQCASRFDEFLKSIGVKFERFDDIIEEGTPKCI